MILSDPIFSIRETGTRARQAGLFDLLAAAYGGTLLELRGMAAHQRPAVATVFAIIGHVLKRYEPDINTTSPDDLADAWRRLIGPDALRLEAADAEVAFLQPPTDPPKSQQSIESADALLPAAEHEVKRTWETTPERALFAIMGSIMRPNTKDHRSATRTGLCCVLTSVDGSFGGEVVNLIQAYDQRFPPTAGTWSAKDHMVWLRPYQRADQPIPLGDLPKPFLDVGRAQRLRLQGDGRVQIWANPCNTPRVAGGPDPWLDDLHTPLLTGAKSATRYKLAKKQFGYAFQAHLLFGGIAAKEELLTRPRIMDLTSYKVARICGLGSDQGKTLGYREAIFRAGHSDGLFTLAEPARDDRPSRLSEALIMTLGEGESSLGSALASIRRAGDKRDATSKQIANQGKAIFRSRVTQPAIDLIFDLLSNGGEDPSAEQSRTNGLVASELRASFSIAVPATVEPLGAARAQMQLEAAIARKFPVATAEQTNGGRDSRMPAQSDDDNKRPPLARQVFAILTEFTRYLSPNDRARLRTMSLTSPPLAFWKLLAQVPEEQSESRRCVDVWKTVLRSLGRVNQSRMPLGRVLERTGFPENRVSRLLAGTGSSLPGHIDEVGRWLVSHQVEHADLSLLATLGLADALGDVQARDWARRRLAIDFVQFRPVSAAPADANGSDEETVDEEAA
jgi:hypothetical protein